jgi:hypothetical protein
MNHKTTARKSIRYANTVEATCTCGWLESIHLDHDGRFTTLREVWREIRFLIQDHKQDAHQHDIISEKVTQ